MGRKKRRITKSADPVDPPDETELDSSYVELELEVDEVDNSFNEDRISDEGSSVSLDLDLEVEYGSSDPEEPTNEDETKTKKRKKRPPRGQWCSAVGCKHTRYKLPGLSFFRFPKDEERCNQWIANCGRQDLKKKTVDELYSANVLCAVHFADTEFFCYKRNRLKRGKGVPTLFKERINNAVLCDDKPPLDVPPPSPPPPPPPAETVPILPDEEVVKKSTVITYKDRIIHLTRKIRAQEKRIKRLKVKMEKVVPIPRSKSKAEVNYIKTITMKYFPPETHRFFCSLFDSYVSKKEIKWTDEDKNFALSICDISPKAYYILQNYIMLPTAETPRGSENESNNISESPKGCENVTVIANNTSNQCENEYYVIRNQQENENAQVIGTEIRCENTEIRQGSQNQNNNLNQKVNDIIIKNQKGDKNDTENQTNSFNEIQEILIAL